MNEQLRRSIATIEAWQRDYERMCCANGTPGHANIARIREITEKNIASMIKKAALNE